MNKEWILASVLETRDERHPLNRHFKAFQQDPVVTGLDLCNTVIGYFLRERIQRRNESWLTVCQGGLTKALAFWSED